MKRKCCITTGKEFLLHDAGLSHPENSGRLIPLHAMLDSEFAAIPRIGLRSALEGELLKVHAEDMIRRIVDVKGQSDWLDADTYLNEHSTDVALLAAGSAIDTALRIWNGEYTTGFCFLRPPGHHATPTESMGFCLFNNVALAVQAVLTEKPVARIAIVDFDLHHGNGTQDAFWKRENVLFISSHRFPFYPGTGALKETGQGKGAGTTVNFPVAERRGDAFFKDLYGHIALPMLKEFDPEMIFVSAGFDGHADDPMRGFQITTHGYRVLAQQMLIAGDKCGKVLFCLEGGYNPMALKNSVREILLEMTEEEKRETENLRGSGLKALTDLNHGTEGEPTLDLYKTFFRTFFTSL